MLVPGYEVVPGQRFCITRHGSGRAGVLRYDLWHGREAEIGCSSCKTDALLLCRMTHTALAVLVAIAASAVVLAKVDNIIHEVSFAEVYRYAARSPWPHPGPILPQIPP